MDMPLKLAFILFIIFVSAASFAQDSALLSKNNSRSNIAIISRDGLTINGRVLEITLDYILLDALDLNSPVTLSAYYIRPSGNYYKIDVEYIQAAVLRAKKKTGQSAMAGAVSGAFIGGDVVNDGDASVSTVAAASGAGLAIGALVGTAKGLGRKKVVIPIYGKSENLISLLNYYQ
jgi:hypothetical protein